MINRIDFSKLAPILSDFVNGYIQDSPADIEQWLDSKLQSSIPNHSSEEIRSICNTIIRTAETNTALNESINKATANGQSMKSWFAEQMKQLGNTCSSGELGHTISVCKNAVLNATTQNISEEPEQYFSTEVTETVEKYDNDDWNLYRIKDLAYDTADKISALSISTICDSSLYEISDTLGDITLTGLSTEMLNTTGLKAVVSGALQTAVSNNVIQVLPNDTPADVICNIACNALNNLNIFNRISNGAISVIGGIENIAQNAIVSIAGMTLEIKGMALGTAIGSVFGPVGSMIGGAVGSVVSRFIGASVGNKISAIVYKVGNMARTAVKNFGNKIKEFGSNVFNYLFG